MQDKAQKFELIFNALKSLLQSYEPRLSLGRHGEGDYHLHTNLKMKRGSLLYFGGVEIRKSYVSFHLMPVYCCPEMTESISPELRKRMQGKSCFNFSAFDPILFDQLSALVEDGFQRFQSDAIREKLAQF